MPFSWEDQINDLFPDEKPDATTLAQCLEKYEDLIKLVSRVENSGPLIEEMERHKEVATKQFLALVAAIEHDAVRFDDPEKEAEYYAAMSFVTWYLHKSWKTLRDPLPLPYAKVMGYMFLVGLLIGRHQEGHHVTGNDSA